MYLIDLISDCVIYVLIVTMTFTEWVQSEKKSVWVTSQRGALKTKVYIETETTTRLQISSDLESKVVWYKNPYTLYTAIAIGLGFAVLVIYGLIFLFRTLEIRKKKRRLRRRHHTRPQGNTRNGEPRRHPSPGAQQDSVLQSRPPPGVPTRVLVTPARTVYENGSGDHDAGSIPSGSVARSLMVGPPSQVGTVAVPEPGSRRQLGTSGALTQGSPGQLPLADMNAAQSAVLAHHMNPAIEVDGRRHILHMVSARMRRLSLADLSVRDSCLICLEEFRAGEPVPEIPHPCLRNNNFVHKDCLEKWFKTTAGSGRFACPMCRLDIGNCFDRRCASIIHIPRTSP